MTILYLRTALRKSRSSLAANLSWLLCFCCLATAQAATYTISPATVDSNEEFENIANSLQAGSELVLRGGTYSQTGRRAITANGTPDNPIVIRAATGATGVTRQEAPKLYNALENLCVSRGLPMPRLEIVEDPALNAYASGLSPGNYAIAVTRGLLDKLNDQELEAVLAHELTHIRNRDTQMMVIAIIFAGVFAFFGDLAIRRWDFPYGWSPQAKRGDRSSQSRDSDGGGGRDGGGALLAIALAIAIILITWGISTLIRLALSRSREYLADAGSVELTKNPDAMIAALRKIDNHAGLDVVSRMEAFYIENPVRSRVSGFLETHPSIADRIAAIEKYAGGREMAPR